MNLRDVLSKRAGTPCTVEKRTAGRIMKRMMKSRKEGSANEVVLPTGSRGKVILDKSN